ncbi:heme peroxidase [Mycena capillaripes]|nr:heme peroxidase [Mycena capillaripes]
MFLGLGFTLAFATTSATAYIWPSPKLDALEAMRWDQDSLGFAVFFQPCDEFIFGPAHSGRSNAADWIRTAYHDMATHNVEDSTGGLDASIRFTQEQSRPENPGTGFKNTIAILVASKSRYLSLADLIAIGAITAIETCGGPQIDFRGGRIDSAKPNSAGVPEPQQGLQEHIDSFARQGFTKTEMIGLIACGHTFGGVQHKPFPQIVPDLNDPNNTLSVAHFDSTFGQFDNKIATEYISGTTQNPLVVGANHTTRSDKRIFASDGNATMASFAESPDVFASTCASLFARMLNTVPKGVELTQVIDPLPIKPKIKLILDGDTLKLTGSVRLWGVGNDPKRHVRLLWEDQSGATAGNVSLPADVLGSALGGRIPSIWYNFNQTAKGDQTALLLKPKAGITNMRFTVNGKLEDQGGVGFEVQDGIMFSTSSCRTSKDPFKGRIDIAVRNGFNPDRVYLEETTLDDVNRTVVNEINVPKPVQPVAANSAYSLWSFNTDSPKGFYIGAEVNGAKISTSEKHSLKLAKLCD